MQNATRATTAQRLGRIVVGGAVALLLAGSMADTTEAMKRSQAARMVNHAVGWCFSMGGDPVVQDMAGAGYGLARFWEDGGNDFMWFDYENEDQGGVGGEAVTADDLGNGTADTADQGKVKKAHKQHKRKSRAGKRLFGEPPLRDVERLRGVAMESASL
jgi:hypothetical protein